jgi:hypothetical protein
MVFSGCVVDDDGNSFNESKDIEVENDLQLLLEGSGIFQMVALKNEMELYVRGDSAEIAIKNTRTGDFWYSNPQDSANDANAGPLQQSLQKSQLQVEYFRNDNSSEVMNSYDDCVSRSQHRYASLTDGVRVTYFLGEQENRFLVPTLLTKERFDYLTSQLSGDDKEYLQGRYAFFSLNNTVDSEKDDLLERYPALEEHDLYTLPDNPADFLMEKLDAIFKKIGYTEQDLITDNAENSVKEREKPIQFRISIEYILQDDGLLARIPTESIDSSPDVELTKIAFLPYFGSASLEEDGYMFVPDGSGALIHFNNGKTKFPSYRKTYYGSDLSLIFKEQTSIEKNSYLPIYGIKKEEQAVLAVVEEGDAVAELNADISGRYDSYNTIYPSFQLRSYNKQTLFLNNSAFLIADKMVESDFAVRFLFLHGENADYSGMANAYQKYLVRNERLHRNTANSDLPFTIHLLGMTDINTSVLGFPMNRHQRLTGYQDVLEIANELQRDNVPNMNIQYKYAMNDGKNNTVYNRLITSRALGGEQDFDRLLQEGQQQGIHIFPDADFQFFAKNRFMDRFNRFFDSAKAITNDFSYYYDFDIATQTFDFSTRKYVIKPSSFSSYYQRFLRSYEEYDNKFISLSSLGTYLYSDFDEKSTYDRAMTERTIVEMLEDMKNSGYQIMTSGANAYLLPYVAHISSMPMTSSKHYLFDETVPFYQMVVHGYIPYSSEPLNYKSDENVSFLQLLETGTMPAFEGMYAENQLLKKSNNQYINLHYGQWIDDAVALYHRINDATRDLQQYTILAHEKLDDGVFSLTYENGSVIIVNYTDAAFIHENLTVASHDFQLLEGDEMDE